MKWRPGHVSGAGRVANPMRWGITAIQDRPAEVFSGRCAGTVTVRFLRRISVQHAATTTPDSKTSEDGSGTGDGETEFVVKLRLNARFPKLPREFHVPSGGGRAAEELYSKLPPG